MWIRNFQISELGLEKAEEQEIKLSTFSGSQRKQGNSRKTFTCVSSTMLKPMTVWIITNCGKLFKIQEYQTVFSASCETCMWVKKQQLEPCMEQLTSSRLRKEYYRALSCHLVCLTYMLSTSWEMLGYMSYKLESRQMGEISANFRYVNDTTLMAESEEELKSLLMRMREESERAGLKLNIKKIKIMASIPISSWQIEGENVEVVTDFLFLVSKITVDGDCTMKSEDHCFLAGKLWRT